MKTYESTILDVVVKVVVLDQPSMAGIQNLRTSYGPEMFVPLWYFTCNDNTLLFIIEKNFIHRFSAYVKTNSHILPIYFSTTLPPRLFQGGWFFWIWIWCSYNNFKIFWKTLFSFMLCHMHISWRNILFVGYYLRHSPLNSIWVLTMCWIFQYFWVSLKCHPDPEE